MEGISGEEHCRDEDADVDRRAAEWFALLLDNGATATDRANFRAWLVQDPAHAKAYAELEHLWLGASALPEATGPASSTRRTIVKSGGALAVLATIGVSTSIYLRSAGGDYQTGVGGTARFILPDGSIAELSTSSAISLNFTANRRQVVLNRGEAFFTVKSDPSRSFVVDCQQLRSTALGTQFSVSERDEGIIVSVAEHTVRVASPSQEHDVQEGQSVLFANGQLSAPTQTDVSTQVSWRDGKLVFISTPFEDVVATLSKWRRGKMIVMDKALARRPVSIIVDVRRAGRILENLEHGLPIRIASYSPWLSLIYPQ
jgi:transmembrane sensor